MESLPSPTQRDQPAQPGPTDAFPRAEVLRRRRFLEVAGLGAVCALALPRWPAIAGPFEAADVSDHFVPADKKLRPEWIETLSARGERTWYSGSDLETIGMPVGGLCAGQVYLAGDGTLTYWDIFNQHVNSGYGAVNYKVGRAANTAVSVQDSFSMPALQQGVAIRIRQGDNSIARRLNHKDFPRVRFCGEYPIGFVDFVDPSLPVQLQLAAFSPFIPLNEEDSALPATLLCYRIKNVSETPVEVSLAGWLENAVCRHSHLSFAGRAVRQNRRLRQADLTAVLCGVRELPPSERPQPRPPIMFADFEGQDYGPWRVEGAAFGDKPAKGTLENQQAVSGFEGRGLINTYLGGDGPHGKLISPSFTIERPWITFLIGGGAHQGQTCLNLVTDGEVVRTATGQNNERLQPHNWHVEEFSGKTARLEIVDTASGGWGHINIDQIEFRDEPRLTESGSLVEQSDYGSMAIVVLGGADGFGRPDVSPEEIHELRPSLFTDSDSPGAEKELRPDARPLVGAVGKTLKLSPGQEAEVTFVVAWCFPNLRYGDKVVGNYYAERFGSAREVVEYLARNRARLQRETRLWHQTYYESSLPRWLLDRLHSTVSNLATKTCHWWRNGRFWAWEGCGCCHGTCGHVWNYEHAMARLFPRWERSVRELQDFAPGVGLWGNGAIAFRGEGWGAWAGDAQGGYILKAYREHLLSPDAGFLERNWKHIRLATQFLLEQDGNADGLIEGSQHQTYDENYFGANTMVGSLYLGALRAAEEMAREVGEVEFAARCRKIVESGSRLSSQRLFNGEYFIQDVDLKQHPDWQYADGCLADQMFGQGWAHQVGLGYLYPAEQVRAALRSVWKYSWAPDIGPQNRAHPPERWFAYPGEAGLFTCTWPKSKHLGPTSTRYRNEIWTGIEYQVAGHMVWEGMVTEALAICRGVHERYHPSKHNPWNEIECGDHYARALASWGVFLALCGFEYHGPAKKIGFAPRLQPEDFSAAFTAAEGWGTLTQTRREQTQTNGLELKWGKLSLQQITIALPEGVQPKTVRLQIDRQEAAVTWRADRNSVRVDFAQHDLRAGQAIELTTEWTA